MLPGILNHLGPSGVHQLKKMAMENSLAGARAMSNQAEEGDDIPSLVEDFESISTGSGKKAPTEVVD